MKTNLLKNKTLLQVYLNILSTSLVVSYALSGKFDFDLNQVGINFILNF
jgi:hypothetical protein